MAEIPGVGGGAPIPNPGPSTAYLGQLTSQYAAQRAIAQPSEPLVYFGGRNRPAPGSGASFRDPETIFTPDTRTIGVAMSDFEAMTSAEKRKLAERLALAGMLTVGSSGGPYKGETMKEFVSRANLVDVQNSYGDLLQAAASRYSAGQQMTPDELLDMHIEYNRDAAEAAGGIPGWYGASGDGGESGSPYANKTVTTTNSQRDIYSADEARGLARAILRRELDRDPTDEEYEDFVSALQTKQRENPTVTTTRTRYDENGSPTNTSSTTRGGVDLEQFAQDQAEDNPDWATWQAIGTFLPALFEELGSGVPGV